AGAARRDVVTHRRGRRVGQTTRFMRYFLTSLEAQVLARQLVRLMCEDSRTSRTVCTMYAVGPWRRGGCPSGPLRERSSNPRRLASCGARPAALTPRREHRGSAPPCCLVSRGGAASRRPVVARIKGPCLPPTAQRSLCSVRQHRLKTSTANVVRDAVQRRA